MRFSLLCGSSFPNRTQSSRQLTIARNSNRKFILWSFVPREGWKNEGDVYNQREPEVSKSPNTIFYGIFLHFFRNDAKFLSLSCKQCFSSMHVYLDNFFHKISVKRIHTRNKTIYFSLKISPVTCFSLKHLHSLEMSRFTLKHLYSLETSTSTLKHLHSLEISRFTRHCVFFPVSAT